MTQTTRQAGIRPARPQREPREGERIWNGHNVDKNLEDAWLATLNSLKVFDLISICEGHVTGGRGLNSARPHLNLRIKENLLPIFVSKFDNISNRLHSSIVELFAAADTTADLELKIKLNCSRSRQEIRRDLVFHIEARFTRQSIEMESEVLNWFNKVVCNVEKFDDFTASILPVG